ncbi:MAG: hypothetical protein IPN49_08320 [Saprospiraceae bacterium]|nr:hypothetical protein [Saprospiraceae bacterium]
MKVISEIHQKIDIPLLNKISDLFEYRMFPLLMDKIDETSEKKHDFYQNLTSLQTSIYHLDAHLEKNWIVDEKIRLEHWHNIITQTKKCLPKDMSPHSFLTHIHKYEKHELAIRNGKLPTRFKMEYFYFYKSCDVKLLRRLIYLFGNLESRFGSLTLWRDFDFVTEVNDDIEDVFEDMSFYNGNRFLIHLLVHGKKSAEKEFSEFLNNLKDKISIKLNSLKMDSFAYEINSFAFLQCENTLHLLSEKLEIIEMNRLNKESVLRGYLYKWV